MSLPSGARRKKSPANASRPDPAAVAQASAGEPGHERMSRVDTAWLRMDNDVNLMMIVGVWLLQPALPLARLAERIESKLLQYRRFKQRVVEDSIGANWVDDASFDINNHLLPTKLQRRKGQTERGALQELAGQLASTALDMTRPLWQFHLIEDYEGGSALILRIHHCIGDGIALTSVMLSLTDEGKDPPRASSRGQHKSGHGGEPGPFDELLKPLGDMTAKVLEIYGRGMDKAAEAIADPRRPLLDSLEVARTGYQVASDIAAFALMDDDSPTRLKGQPIGAKVVAWGDPIPLDQVKAVGKGLACSINDVLLACVAGAIGSYLQDHGEDPEGKEIRAMVPVNLRPLDQAYQLGNRFGLVPLILPIGIANPVQRVYAVRARMRELKGSFQPLLAFGLLTVAGLLIKPLQDALLGQFAKKATAVMTNVPGPANALQFCGSTLRQTMFWVPQSGAIGVGVSILSYAGGVQFGLITDQRLCPDPQAIIARFEPEFEKLLMTTMMLPWAD